jgi:hypothetical protein
MLPTPYRCTAPKRLTPHPGLLGAGVSLALWLGAAPAVGGPASVPMPSVTESLIIERSNALRGARGLAPAEPDPQLTAAARSFARFMAREEAYGHEADGRTVMQRVAEAGYRHCIVAENIAWQYSSRDFDPAVLAQRFMDGWQQSPSHRRNLLDADVTDIGVAVARSAASGRYYAVQVLARPEARSLRFRISNDGQVPLLYRVDGRAYRLDSRGSATHEHCRAAEVTLQVPGQRHPTVLQPVDGGHYRVGPAGLRG